MEKIKKDLEDLVELIDSEINSTGTIRVGGYQMFRNSSRRDNPYAGLCHAAVAKLDELARDLKPSLKIYPISFIIANDDVFKQSRHVVAEVETSDGNFCVDPTIKQYLPHEKGIYGPAERYPLKIVKGSIYRKT